MNASIVDAVVTIATSVPMAKREYGRDGGRVHEFFCCFEFHFLD